jgi:hypothetical protein
VPGSLGSALEEENFAKRIFLMKRPVEYSNKLVAVGEKAQRTRSFSDGWRLAGIIEVAHSEVHPRPLPNPIATLLRPKAPDTAP